MELSKTQDKTQYTELSRKTDDEQKSSPINNTARMVNGHEVSKTFYRFITIEKSYSVSLGLQLFLTVLYYQFDFICQQQKSILILYSLNFSALPSILLGIFSHFSYNDLKKSQMKDLQILSPHQLVLGCIIILIQPYFFLQHITINNYDMKNSTDVEYKLNYVLVLGSLIKSILLIPCLMNMLKFKNPRTSRICKIYGCPNSNLYTIKCCFKQYPITLVSVSFIFSFLFFSFAYRVGQRNLIGNASRFDYFQNTIWMVIVTMTAVGFGDIVPQTIIGRLVGFICTFCGVMTVSIMLLVVINTFQLDQNQNKSLRLLKRLEQKKQIKIISAKYVRQALWRIWKNYKRSKQNIDYQMEQQSRDEKLLRKILRQRIRLSKFNDTSVTDLGLEMNRQFQNIQYNVENLMQNSDQILNYLSNQYFINLEEIKQDTKAVTGFSHG